MKKTIIALTIILVFISVSFTPLTGTKKIVEITHNRVIPSKLEADYTNITQYDLWELLNDTSNGIQIPIDVRSISEWRTERINTPIPEHPRWYYLELLKDDNVLPKFLYQYSNCSVVLMCKSGYRSFTATKILIENNFTGEIYNLIGGINAWKQGGLPTAPGSIYNITVYEAWELLNTTINGIQQPIDIRPQEEWNRSQIDTPIPEDPIYQNYTDLIKNNIKRQLFMTEHVGEELIFIDTNGYQSPLATGKLFHYNFTGTLYSIIGGIEAWIEAGLPIIIKNQPPKINIINPKEYYVHLSGIPLFPIILIPIIDCISIGGFKLRPVIINATDDFDNSSDLIVKVYLDGEEKGNASYCCDWKLHEWFWTGRAHGIYNLTITGEDSSGAIGSDGIWVRNLCFV